MIEKKTKFLREGSDFSLPFKLFAQEIFQYEKH